MPRIRLLVLLPLTTILALPSAALGADGDCRQIRGAETPEDPADDVFVCRQDNWIHQGLTKLGNAAAFGQDSFPSWDTTEPTTPLGMGGGGAYVTNSLFHQQFTQQDPRASFVAEGTYTGVLDNVAVDLYAWIPPIWSDDVNLQLIVDGEVLYSARVNDVRRTPSGDLAKLSFAYENIYNAMDLFGMENLETTEHTVRIAANGVFIVNDPAIFVYDASDAPSGLIFNHETLSLYTRINVLF